jgi:RHS repeat-associated protein
VNYTLAYDEENRIETVTLPVQADITTEQTWTFEYDGNGTRIRQGNPDGSQLLLLNGGRYHVKIAADTTESTTRYYSIAGQRPAMRNNDGSINYLLGDHLGSVSTVVDASGQIVSQSRYLPFGNVLWEDGDSPTDYTYTGQRSLSDIGLMDYNARFYDPMLGRFTSPDSIIPDPGSVIGYNRYAYVNNNPMIYTDPSGHSPIIDDDPYGNPIVDLPTSGETTYSWDFIKNITNSGNTGSGSTGSTGSSGSSQSGNSSDGSDMYKIPGAPILNLTLLPIYGSPDTNMYDTTVYTEYYLTNYQVATLSTDLMTTYMSPERLIKTGLRTLGEGGAIAILLPEAPVSAPVIFIIAIETIVTTASMAIEPLNGYQQIGRSMAQVYTPEEGKDCNEGMKIVVIENTYVWNLNESVPYEYKDSGFVGIYMEPVNCGVSTHVWVDDTFASEMKKQFSNP